MSRSAGTWSTTGHHSRLKNSPAAGRIFQLPASSRSRSRVGNDNSQARYSGLTRSSAGLSDTVAGIKVTLIGIGGSMPGGSSWPCSRSSINSSGRSAHTIFSPMRTKQRSTPARSRIGCPLSGSIHQERKSATQESASGLHVARIRPHTAGRAVAAHHVKELMGREMRQFIKADQRNLCTLPVINRGFELQMGKLDLAAPRPAPLAQPHMRGAAKPRVNTQALVPERSGVGNLWHRAPEEDGGEIGDPTDMAQRLQDQAGGLPATRRPAIDA